MSVYTKKIRGISPLSQILRLYREKYMITQEHMAIDLCVDVRTLRRWENGETILHDIRELRRIATLLGIEPERLGIAKSVSSELTIEQINSALAHIWHLINAARSYEANTLVEHLIKDLHTQIVSENPRLLYKLAQALHLAGYVKSVVTRSHESLSSLNYYREMERVARIINDDTLLNIALTYEGDMYCRVGENSKGISFLEAARDTTPKADTAARGNGIQLLGRAYLRVNQLGNFERAMAESEELAYEIDPQQNSTCGQYSLGTVYEEYGRSYAHLGRVKQALEYLDKAEKSLEPTKHWEILIKTARSMALVRGGELQSGVAVAVAAVQDCREHGTIRLLERLYSVQHYLDQMTKDLGMVGAHLREALDGQVEY